MKFYTYDVAKNTVEGQDVWEVVETPTSGGEHSVMSGHDNEVDARITARYNEAFQEYGHHILACIATGKWMMECGLRPVNVNIAFFDKDAGMVNTTKAFEALWRSM